MRGVRWIHIQRPIFTPVVFHDPAGKNGEEKMRGVGWTHIQRPTFTPVVFHDPAGKIVYMPPNAYQPTIPKQPPVHHVILDNNLLTL